jgi:hypothetical protein
MRESAGHLLTNSSPEGPFSRSRKKLIFFQPPTPKVLFALSFATLFSDKQLMVPMLRLEFWLGLFCAVTDASRGD